jgi:hypothetical protein
LRFIDSVLYWHIENTAVQARRVGAQTAARRMWGMPLRISRPSSTSGHCLEGAYASAMLWVGHTKA